MTDQADPTNMLAFFDLIKRVDADRRAHFVAELAAFSFIIEKGLATPQEVTARLQLVRQTMPVEYQQSDVGDRIGLLSQVITSAYERKPREWTPTVIQGGLDQTQKIDPDPPKTQD